MSLKFMDGDEADRDAVRKILEPEAMMDEKNEPDFPTTGRPRGCNECQRLQARVTALDGDGAALREALKDAVQVARNYHMLFHDANWKDRLTRWESALLADPASRAPKVTP